MSLLRKRQAVPPFHTRTHRQRLPHRGSWRNIMAEPCRAIRAVPCPSAIDMRLDATNVVARSWSSPRSMRNHRRSALAAVSASVLVSPAAAARTPGFTPGPMLQRFLDGPMKGVDEIVFAVRVSGARPLVRQLRQLRRRLARCREAGLQVRRRRLLGLRRGRPALPAEPAHRQAEGAAGRPQGRRPRSAGPLRRPEDPLLLPQGRHAPLSPLRDQHRRHAACGN